VPGVFALIAERGGIEPREMWRVFNMGCGFCCVVPADRADEAVAGLARHHPGTAVIGHVTDAAGGVALPSIGLRFP
jgi:phosphoribosylformylglycinamidine cyclo-ligase